MMGDKYADTRPSEADLSLEVGRTPEALRAQAEADARERHRLDQEAQKTRRVHGMMDVYREYAEEIGRPIGVLVVLAPDGDYVDCFGLSKEGGAEWTQGQINSRRAAAEAKYVQAEEAT